MQRTLSDLKTKARRRAESPTFVWDSLVQSFATMGNSRGWAGLVENRENASRVSYEVVEALLPAKRLVHLDQVLRDAVVRMPAQKARWLVENFRRIDTLGGVAAANRAAFDAPGREAKLAFMLQFDGIGDKYARNIWMDVYHPDFHDAIAVDERIKKITTALGYSFARYTDHEQFYQDLAKDAGLQPWELDRLLYHFNGPILARITR
jgi:thermostable 8-oxoguanine DNA glycosylase